MINYCNVKFIRNLLNLKKNKHVAKKSSRKRYIFNAIFNAIYFLFVYYVYFERYRGA